MGDERDPLEVLWLRELAHESTSAVRKNRQIFQIDIHSPEHGLLVLCPPKQNPMTAKMVKQYESTLPNMSWLSIDPVSHPPPATCTRAVLHVACSGEHVYSTLCGVFGKENLYDDACSKWMKVYDPTLWKRIERSVNSYLHTAKRGMGKHEWIEEQSRTKDITLGHVYAQLRCEGYVMHKHVKKCVRSCCMDWMNNPYTDYDKQCVVRIQRWYRCVCVRCVVRNARMVVQSVRSRTRLCTAMDTWRAVVSATRTIQRAFRAHLATRVFRRMCCQWVALRFVRNIAHYYSPENRPRIVGCQRACRAWLDRHRERRSGYVCI